jgi:hypothetical protein
MHASNKLPVYPDLVVLGGGKRLFGDSGGADLRLVDSTTTGTGRGPRAPCRRGGGGQPPHT